MIRLENVLKTSLQDVFDDVLKKYSKRLEDVFARRLQDVLKTSWRNIENGSWRRLADVWPKRIYWSGPRRLGDVLKSSSEDVCLMRINLSSSRRLENVYWRRRQKRFSRRLHEHEFLMETDQISLSACLYFVRYWAICVLQLILTSLWRHEIWSYLL